ncbi:unnamed protein product [Caenorhabditis nigoni]
MGTIPEFLKSNDHHLKFCILYEVALKKPIYDSYRSFCDAVGHDAMEYRDFEFWYHRFGQGKLDFDYDRSRDPVPMTFLDMPVEIMGKITEDLNPFERMYLRSMNHATKDVIDSFPTVFKEMWITAENNKLVWRLDGRQFECEQEENGCTFSRPKYLHIEKSNEKVTEKYEEGYINKSLEYLNLLFQIPKLQVNSLWLDLKTHTPELDDLLPVAFYAKGVSITASDFDKTVQILLKMKPGHLEWFDVNFEGQPIERELLIEKVFETEQFKQAKMVSINGVELNLEDLTDFSHMKNIYCWVKSIGEPEEILQFRDTLSSFKNLERGKIVYKRNGSSIRPFAEALEEDVLVGPRINFTHRYNNPESNKTLEFKIQEVTDSRSDWGVIDILKVA